MLPPWTGKQLVPFLEQGGRRTASPQAVIAGACRVAGTYFTLRGIYTQHFLTRECACVCTNTGVSMNKSVFLNSEQNAFL